MGPVYHMHNLILARARNVSVTFSANRSEIIQFGNQSCGPAHFRETGRGSRDILGNYFRTQARPARRFGGIDYCSYNDRYSVSVYMNS